MALMVSTGFARKFWSVAVACVAVAGASAAPAVADGVAAPLPPLPKGRYLNIHQCVYKGAEGNYYTNILPKTADAEFNTGTNVSDTQETSPICGPGGGGWFLSAIDNAVFSVNLTDPNNRYLNINQCVYHFPATGRYLTNIMPNTGNTPYNTRTTTSGGEPAIPGCDAGTSHSVHLPLYSSVFNVDLDQRILNIHQCIYTDPSGTVFSNIMPNTPARYRDTGTNTSTNIDPKVDTRLVCDTRGGWPLQSTKSGVYSVSLWQ
ncbi:hypothetical protein ABZX75_33745 [Streptomyces sp. NPDC003038]|uniref:hypothetical protein n=1 Tax=unclassified Streptomyces TaxID=2593676 RepID=UPI0033A45EAF